MSIFLSRIKSPRALFSLKGYCMIIKYSVVKVEDTGQRNIINTFSDVIGAIEFHKSLRNGAFSYHIIEVFYIE